MQIGSSGSWKVQSDTSTLMGSSSSSMQVGQRRKQAGNRESGPSTYSRAFISSCCKPNMNKYPWFIHSSCCWIWLPQSLHQISLKFEASLKLGLTFKVFTGFNNSKIIATEGKKKMQLCKGTVSSIQFIETVQKFKIYSKMCFCDDECGQTKPPLLHVPPESRSLIGRSSCSLHFMLTFFLLFYLSLLTPLIHFWRVFLSPEMEFYEPAGSAQLWLDPAFSA